MLSYSLMIEYFQLYWQALNRWMEAEKRTYSLLNKIIPEQDTYILTSYVTNWILSYSLMMEYFQLYCKSFWQTEYLHTACDINLTP